MFFLHMLPCLQQNQVVENEKPKHVHEGVLLEHLILRYQPNSVAYLEKNHIIDGSHCTYFSLYTLEAQKDIEKYVFMHITLCRSGV